MNEKKIQRKSRATPSQVAAMTREEEDARARGNRKCAAPRGETRGRDVRRRARHARVITRMHAFIFFLRFFQSPVGVVRRRRARKKCVILLKSDSQTTSIITSRPPCPSSTRRPRSISRRTAMRSSRRATHSSRPPCETSTSTSTITTAAGPAMDEMTTRACVDACARLDAEATKGTYDPTRVSFVPRDDANGD